MYLQLAQGVFFTVFVQKVLSMELVPPNKEKRLVPAIKVLSMELVPPNKEKRLVQPENSVSMELVPPNIEKIPKRLYTRPLIV